MEAVNVLVRVAVTVAVVTSTDVVVVVVVNDDLRVQHKDRIFSSVRPFYEQAVSDLYRSMHRSL
jgi:hypothetical protein